MTLLAGNSAGSRDGITEPMSSRPSASASSTSLAGAIALEKTISNVILPSDHSSTAAAYSSNRRPVAAPFGAVLCRVSVTGSMSARAAAYSSLDAP